DGKLDLAVVNAGNGQASTNGTISLLLGKGDGTFQAAVDYGAGTNPVSLVVGDFNGDGKLDLAVANLGSYVRNIGIYTNSAISVLLGKGDGTFRAALNYDVGT